MKRMFVFILVFILLGFSLVHASSSGPPHVNIIHIKDTINPGVEEFISYAINTSEDDGAECLIILLDTPGGLMSSMRGIAEDILNSGVPIVVYVYPAAAQAATAGVFVTAAADIAAMAPGTNIGSAHPVTAGGGDVPSTMNEKVVNDMLAFARSIAGERGRNADWLEDSIRRSVSATAQEAFEKNVIDLVVSDVPTLLKKLDGWQILHKGQSRILHTGEVEQRTIEPGWQHMVLSVIANPNIAYILLMIGIAGLYFEFSHPGAVAPGVVGAIALVLALYAMRTLPVNLAGALLIFLAIVFFLLEIKVASYGLLSFAGVLSLILGSLMLFRVTGSEAGVALGVLLPTVTLISAFFVAVARLAFRAQRAKLQTGSGTMVGLTGEVKEELNPDGKVFVYGELWNAQAEEYVPVGEKVKVVSVDNLKLKVKKIGDR